MSTSYPTALDTTATLINGANDATVTAVTHAGAHNNIADSLIAIETELGTLPKGTYTDVKARLADAFVKSPSTAQVIRASADVVVQTIRKNTGTDVSNLSEWRDHLNVILAYMDAASILSAQGFRVAGTLLNSTHLSDSAALARLAGPTFTGTVSAPTPTVGDNSTKVATTAFVEARVTPAVKVYNSVAQASAAGFNQLVFDTEFFKLGDATQHSTTVNNSRLIAKTAGVYHILAQTLMVPSGGNTFYEFYLLLNGSTYFANAKWAVAPSFNNWIQVSSIFQLGVNDYVEAVMNHDGTATMGGGLTGASLSFVKVA